MQDAGYKVYISKDEGKTIFPLDDFQIPGLRAIKKTPLQDAINLYLKTCTAKKCIKNQSNEKLYFIKFRDFLKEAGIEYIDEVKIIHIEAFVNFLSTWMEPISVNRRMSSISNFLNKCVDWELRLLPIKIKKLKVEKKPHKPWPDKVYNAFIKLTDGNHTNLFKFLWTTGCRPKEARNFKWTDIDYEAREITFRCGKMNELSRKFPLSKELDKILHQIKPEALHVFHIRNGELDTGLLYHYAKDRLRRISKLNLTLYGTRHAFGSRLNRDGASGFTILRLMGHKDYRTTQGYIHFEKEQLENWVDKMSGTK